MSERKISLNTQIYSTRLKELKSKATTLTDQVGRFKSYELSQTSLESFNKYVSTLETVIASIEKYSALCAKDMETLQTILDTFIAADNS